MVPNTCPQIRRVHFEMYETRNMVDCGRGQRDSVILPLNHRQISFDSETPNSYFFNLFSTPAELFSGPFSRAPFDGFATRAETAVRACDIRTVQDLL